MGAPAPGTLRIATYNVEWFTNLFDREGRLLADAEPSSRYGISRAEQLGGLGIVFTALDADLVLVVEAPGGNRHRSTTAMLETFAAHFGLRARSALMGFANSTQQEIAVLFDPDRIGLAHDPQGSLHGGEGVPRFDSTYRIDLDIDGMPESLTFAKPPLELALRCGGGGEVLRLIGVHIKSKAPHGAGDAAAALRIAIENRRKQLAQCLWLRARIEAHLTADDSLIVLGDFNDGPGLDEYEKLFGHSGIEIAIGEDGPPALRLHDPHARAVLNHPTAAGPSTARFYLAGEGQYFSALLDYIMVSPDLRARGPRWRIWHPFDDPGCYRVPELREALLQASDHYPVSLDLPAPAARPDGVSGEMAGGEGT